MKPHRLVFATPGLLRTWLFGHAPRSRFAAALALLLALAFAAGTAWNLWQTHAATQDVLESARALRLRAARSAPPQAAAPLQAASASQTQDWELVLRHLGTPWAAILDALEANTPDDVALVAVESDAALGTVRLQVEARSLDTLLAFAQGLKAAAPFEAVRLIKHETQDQDALRPTRLSLELRLKPEASRSFMREATR